MGTIRFGAEQAVRKCARLQPGESVVIITDQATERIAAELRGAAESVSPGKVITYIMEDFGERPEDGSTPLELPEAIIKALGENEVSFFAATAKKGELPAFRWPLMRLATATLTLRHGHMPNINEQIMRGGMCADYDEVARISARVGDAVKEARHITVTTPAGTEFTAEFSPALKWLVLDGVMKPGTPTNLPEGEVYTCPSNVSEGVIVVDGVLGDYFSEKFGLLDDRPVTLHVHDGRVREVSCDDRRLRTELKEYLAQDENANRIGEFAIGTNNGVDRLIGNMLQDEKYPGIHVAMGDPYPQLTGADWESQAHIDALLRQATIDIEGCVIMRDGKFTF